MKHYQQLLRQAVFALGYFLLARFGMAVFSLQPANLTPLWLPSGIALAMCLQWGYRALPWVIVASFAANAGGMSALGSSGQFVHTAIAAAIDGGVGIFAASMFQRFLPDGLARVNDLLKFGFWVCLLPTILSSALLALNLLLGGYIQISAVASFTVMLIVADSLGMLMLFPIYQGWCERAPVSRLCLQWLLALVAVLLVCVVAGFSYFPGAIFLLVPTLVVLSFNVQLLGVAIANAIALAAVFAGTARGLGPLVASDQIDTVFRLIAFAVATALTVLGVSLQRRQLQDTEHSISRWQDIARHDALTGLINRRDFLPRLENEHQRSIRGGQVYTVAMLDLDHFKSINDTHGHGAGDTVLQVFAEMALHNCRTIDTVARVGGEEFCILLPECTAAQAAVAMERLRATVERSPVIWQGQSIPLTVSIGIAALVDAQAMAGQVLARADRALYRAKHAGRNQVVVDGS